MRAARLLATLALALAGPAFAYEEVRGVAHFVERVVLPPDTVFEARVEDVARADAQAVVVGRTRIENPGSPPIAFTIPIDSDKLDARGRYSVRATISRDGQLLMTTDRLYPVLSAGAGRHVELQLRPVASAPRSQTALPPPALARLPATFAGDLPCADCAALRMRLNLYPDRAFYLSQLYEGRSAAPAYDIGSWALSSDGTVLLLAGGREAPLRLRVDADALRLLAPDGSEPPPAPRPSVLRRTTFEAMAPQLLMRGLLRADGEQWSFTECLTRQHWPVAAGAAASAMQAEATRLRGGAGEILVSVEGRVDSVARADGSAQPVLAVQRYIGAWPGETCGVRFGTAELPNILWKLTALNGAPVIAVPGQREPSLVLASADGRRVARGSTGCESFAGTYQLDGNALRLAVQARPGSCPATAAERGYLDALAGVRTWRIVGQHLELYDAQGTMLARYEARALR